MNWFLDPITQHYADFEGRATRQQYGMFTLFSIIVAIGIGLVLALLRLDSVVWAYQLAILLPSLTIGVRRLHDIGRSGWWMLMILVPLLNLALFLGLLIRKGDRSSNEYGTSPYGDMTEKEPATPVPPAPPQAEQPEQDKQTEV